MVHLSFLVRQLSRSQSRILVYHQWGLHLQIVALACLIEEECLQGPLETCHLTDVKRESRPCDFHTEVEVYQIELLQ